MRGRRISKSTRKLDVVLEAVRYNEETSRIHSVRGYRRVGYVWSDILLFDREQIVEILKSKKRVVCGRPAKVQGDFEVLGQIQYTGEGILTCDGGSNNEKEDLGLPLF